MGFDVAYGPEVEDEWHNFIALNIPESHPARDSLENFYITPHMLLRSQTSTIQTRVMEKQKPPVRRDRGRPRVPPRHGRCHAQLHVPPGRGAIRR